MAMMEARPYTSLPEVEASPARQARKQAARATAAWWLLFVAAFGFVAAGAYTVYRGFDAKGQVRDQLIAQHITTPDDASIPNAPVNDAATAFAQAEIIEEHMLEATGGLTYAQMEREDPNRAIAASAESLRTALLSAVLAWNTATLVIGVGAFIGAVGLLMLVTLALIRPERA